MLQFQPQEHLLHSYIVASQSEQARDRSRSIWRRPCSAAVTVCVRAGRAGTAVRSMTACTRT